MSRLSSQSCRCRKRIQQLRHEALGTAKLYTQATKARFNTSSLKSRKEKHRFMSNFKKIIEICDESFICKDGEVKTKRNSL